MAKLTYNKKSFGVLEMSYLNLEDAILYEGTPTALKAVYHSSGTTWDSFEGTDLTYTSDGRPLDGIVTAYRSVIKGDMAMTLTELSIPLREFVETASSRTRRDDYKIYEHILSGSDNIRGSSTGDYLEGFNGNDTIIGGRGSDHLYGYKGADTFKFESKSDSKTWNQDFIHDFSPRQGDKIDLSTMDAKAGVPGNQAFRFIGTDEFSKVKGQLRYEPYKLEQGSDHFVKGSTIQGDINGDGAADFEITVPDITSIKKAYFIL